MINPAPRKNIILEWIKWHFGEVPSSMMQAYKNFLSFNLKHFSVALLLKTLFSHWRRYKESYGKGFNPVRYFKVFISNSISRILGAVIRTTTIIFALILEIIIFILGIFAFIFWLLVPFLILVLIFAGISLL